ncbi:MAG: right-handed parallel beta-helix repeat-containing protein [Planctomycetales bacterium]|nr:right-handed parallel beta-helix repeat-containing protein [Planctomycetales bacterium]
MSTNSQGWANKACGFSGRTTHLAVTSMAIVICLGSGRLLAQNTPAETQAEIALPAAISQLWGLSGELWNSKSRLPDFSYAGYRRGEVALPTDDALTKRPSQSVRQYGAVGDGITDDTHAFEAALHQAAGHVVEVPPGEYVISRQLVIDQSETVLRGCGPDQSRLLFKQPLNDIQPNWGATTTGKRTSNYSWSGGFITLKGQFDSRPHCQVTEPAQRGGQRLVVSELAHLRVGELIRLQMSDEASQSLAQYLYQADPGPLENLLSRASVTWTAAIVSLDHDARTLTLDRPLTTDVRLAWQPRLYLASSSVEESGVQGLAFRFPDLPYGGHVTELGFNAIAMSGVRNCWVRDISIHNCDSGIFISGSQNTVQNIAFTSERLEEPTRHATGHHGITLGGQDNLLTDFDLRTRFMHDLTVTRGSAGNVAMRGRGIDLCFDHHRYAPHSNLFTEIDVGLGSRTFQSGGGAALGRHSAAWTTFWGIASQQPLKWPEGWSPDQINLVGIETESDAILHSNGRWLEPIAPSRLQPRNLYWAQLQRRLSQPKTP